MPEEYTYPDGLARAGDIVGRRIWIAIKESGSDPIHWDPVTRDEAWQQVVDHYGEWDDYKAERQSLPGGLIEKGIVLPDGKLVAIAFIGLKNLDKPEGWRIGFTGLQGGLLTLGTFTQKNLK